MKIKISKKLIKEQVAYKAFNRWLKSIGDKPITIEQYRAYLLGKGLPSKITTIQKQLKSTLKIPEDRDPQQYKSHGPGIQEETDLSKMSKEERKKISSNYTVSISYNKGGYTVIPRTEIKDIGKK